MAVASTIPVFGLLAVGLLGGYVIYNQNKTTQDALTASQARAHTALQAETAILVMSKAEMQLMSASGPAEERAASVLAIQATSTLDESIQRLQQTLPGSPRVAELARLLKEVSPTKMAVIRSVRAGRGKAASADLRSLQGPMERIESISQDLSQEESSGLRKAVENQGKEATSTLRVMGGLVACCIVLSLVAGWELKVRTSELARARQESEMFINCVPSILIGTDKRGRITRWNAAASRVFGLSQTEVLNKPLSDCGVKWTGPNLKREIEAWAGLEKPRPYDDLTFEKSGKARSLGLNVNPISFQQSNSVGFLITGADITERKAMEEGLRQGQKLEAIGQLATGVAHEINTPVQYVSDSVTFVKESWKSIHALLSLSRLVSKEVLEGMPNHETASKLEALCIESDVDYLQTEVPAALEQSLEGLGRIAKIVRAMKEFSHPGSKDKAPVDINHAIESTVDVARSEWKYVADVTTDLDPALPMVPCYAGEFNQVILNLIINAAHAIGDVVKGTNEKGTITLTTRHDGEWVEVQVRDTGSGIPKEIADKVFEPFFTTKDPGKGTGQGLALAHSVIVKKLHGKIWLESAPGKGTTFFLRMPLTEVG